MLAGPWADEAEKAIDTHRKTVLRIIVQGRDGRAAAGAAVHVRQLKHAFEVGFIAPESGIPAYDAEAPVWRAFNAVSLEYATSWSRLQPNPDTANASPPWMPLIADASSRGLKVHAGPLISADPARNPDWVAAMKPADLRPALEQHIIRMTRAGFDSYEVYSHVLDHDMVEKRLGPPMVRRLFELAEAQSTDAQRYIRMSDVMDRRRTSMAVQKIIDWQRDFVPFTGVAIEERLMLDKVQPEAVSLPLRRINALGVTIVFSSLEVGGDTAIQAALNLETVLRLAFATPSVTGVYFRALSPADSIVPHAALFDEQGRPTAAGDLADALFMKHWRSDMTVTTDKVGEAMPRVFAGVYEVTATLPDGTTSNTIIFAPLAAEPRIVVLQPLSPL